MVKPAHKKRTKEKWPDILMQTIDGIARWCFYLGSFLLLVMALSTAYEVLMRYFFTRPTLWSQDLNENFLVYATYLAAAWILRQDRHVAVTILVDRLSPKGRQLMNCVASTLGALTCVVLMWQSLDYTIDLFVSGELHIRSLIIPKWLSWAPVPFGSGLLCIYFVRRAYIFYRGSNHEAQQEPLLKY